TCLQHRKMFVICVPSLPERRSKIVPEELSEAPPKRLISQTNQGLEKLPAPSLARCGRVEKGGPHWTDRFVAVLAGSVIGRDTARYRDQRTTSCWSSLIRSSISESDTSSWSFFWTNCSRASFSRTTSAQVLIQNWKLSPLRNRPCGR